MPTSRPARGCADRPSAGEFVRPADRRSRPCPQTEAARRLLAPLPAKGPSAVGSSENLCGDDLQRAFVRRAGNDWRGRSFFLPAPTTATTARRGNGREVPEAAVFAERIELLTGPTSLRHTGRQERRELRLSYPHSRLETATLDPNDRPGIWPSIWPSIRPSTQPSTHPGIRPKRAVETGGGMR